MRYNVANDYHSHYNLESTISRRNIMKKIIYLEASPRKSRSHSKRVAEAYLDKVKENSEIIFCIIFKSSILSSHFTSKNPNPLLIESLLSFIKKISY